MSFENRTEFITAQASEKLTLATVEARARLYEWVVHSGSIYKKTLSYYAVDLYENQTQMTEVADLGSVTEGEWYYDPSTSILYAHFTGSVDPTTLSAIVTYRLFYATGPCVATADFTDSSPQVRYDGRIIRAPGYKHKVGIEQNLTSIVGQGWMQLNNVDGGLDEIFDTLIFENQRVVIYSWNRNLDISEARIIYRGRITNKSYTTEHIGFTIKDGIFDLENAIPQAVYDDNDTVNSDIKGRYKRWIYGRVDGLKLQSTDQIGEGYALTGTVRMDAANAIMTGTGTDFLNETSPNDTITVGTQEFTVESVDSATQLTMSGESDFSFANENATIVPEIPTATKNREFFVSDHECTTLTKTVTSVVQLNRIELSNTDGLEAGDFIEFTTGERKEIKNVAPGNIVVLRSNVILVPAVSSTVTRQPIQRLFIESKAAEADTFTITNTGGECKITLDSAIEFDLARTTTIGVTMTFTNGSRDVTTTDDVDLREIIKPRDWIRPTDITFTNFYEVLSVDEQSLELRTNFSDPNHTGNTEGKFPDYIGDDTIISAEVLGKTEDGTASGTWIETAAQVVKDIITEVGVPTSEIDSTSFTDAQADARQTISLALPLDPSGGAVTAKSAIDLINKSVYGALTLDNDLRMKYKILQNDIPDSPVVIRDEDIVSWSIKTVNGQNFRDVVLRYRHKDVDRFTLESGSNAVSFTNEFVRDYIGTQKLSEVDAYLFKQRQAEIMAHRYSYFNRLSRADIMIETDLRLENVEIGDVVELDLERLYKRFGDTSTRKKLAIVVGKTVDGRKTKLELTDLGNTFNTTAVIAPNTTNDYSSATTDEKLKYGFITDNQGIVDNDEDTANINLIG